MIAQFSLRKFLTCFKAILVSCRRAVFFVSLNLLLRWKRFFSAYRAYKLLQSRRLRRFLEALKLQQVVVLHLNRSVRFSDASFNVIAIFSRPKT